MIVVTGAGGQLGTALRGLLTTEARYLTRADLDIRDGAAVGPAIAGASLVINCAAYNSVDAAETDPETAWAVNVLAVERLAAESRDAGAGFVTFSTDYVFSGDRSTPYTESAEPGPLSEYGRGKLEGERLALAAHPGALVVRTSWVVSEGSSNFAAAIVRKARQGPLRVVDDQTGHPTIAADLARGVLAAADRNATGLLHLANQGVTTRFGLAREAVELAGLDPELVQPCTSAELGSPAVRPAYSVLDSERLDEIGIDALPHYRPGLGAAVARLASTS